MRHLREVGVDEAHSTLLQLRAVMGLGEPKNAQGVGRVQFTTQKLAAAFDDLWQLEHVGRSKDLLDIGLTDEYLARVDKVQQTLEDVRGDGVQGDTPLLALDRQLRPEHGLKVRGTGTQHDSMGVEETFPSTNFHIAESGLVPQTVQVLKQLGRVFAADEVASVGGSRRLETLKLGIE